MLFSTAAVGYCRSPKTGTSDPLLSMYSWGWCDGQRLFSPNILDVPKIEQGVLLLEAGKIPLN